MPKTDAPIEAAAGPALQDGAAVAAVEFDRERHPAHIVRRVHQRATACFQQVVAGEDITPTQFAALSVTYREGDVSQNRLGRLTAMDPSTISLVVRKLRKLGLVETGRSQTDQRLSILRLTDAGRACAPGWMVKSTEAGRVLLAPLTRAERGLLVDLLQKLAEPTSDR